MKANDQPQAPEGGSLRRRVRAISRIRIMRRRPGVWLVAHDRHRCGNMPAYTIYTVKIRRRYDGRWYHNYNTSKFAWALECWKKECALKWPNLPVSHADKQQQ